MPATRAPATTGSNGDAGNSWWCSRQSRVDVESMCAVRRRGRGIDEFDAAQAAQPARRAFVAGNNQAERSFLGRQGLALMLIDQQDRRVAEAGIEFGKTENDLVAVGRGDAYELRHLASAQLFVQRRAGLAQHIDQGHALP